MVAEVVGEEKEKIEMATAIKKTAAQKKSDERYGVVRQQLTDYLLSGESHSTLIGMTISMDHSDSDSNEIESYVEYVVNQLKNAEAHANRKDNVKKSVN